MGEIAEMMLDGTLCEGCGTYIGESTGYPGYCSKSCARGRGALPPAPKVRRAKPSQPSAVTTKPFGCADCDRRFKKAVALADHRRDVHGDVPAPAPVEAPVCLECGGEGTLVTGREIYPHRPDLYAKSFWRCSCGAYCGCHGMTTKPLGHPCGPVTRAARSAAHAAFDPIWKRGVMDRSAAYAWLSSATGIESERCHIGMMTAEQAALVVDACRTRSAQ